tara:strand:+ start:7150 stop:7833 length:684 start_codon:yes stop_codon:yes gene_type:complete
MNKIITLGCSLTQQEGLANKLSELLNMQLINLAQGSGDNLLQIEKLQDFILDNDIKKDDIIVWQITDVTRRHKNVMMNQWETVKNIQRKFYTPKDTAHFYLKRRNMIDKKRRIALLHNSPDVESIDYDENSTIHTIISTMIMLDKICKLYVWFGWDKVLTPQQFEVFFKILITKKIAFNKKFYVNWAHDNRYNFRYDNLHPDQECAEVFAEKILYKDLIKIKEKSYI